MKKFEQSPGAVWVAEDEQTSLFLSQIKTSKSLYKILRNPAERWTQNKIN